MNINIKLVDGGKTPIFKHELDACADCSARISANTDAIAIPGHTRCLVNLGFAIEIPEGYEGVIRPRSGNSLNGIDIAIGTIDAGYRGEVKACVINNRQDPFIVHNGDRICQLAIRKTEKINFIEVNELSDSERGTDGFGSTEIK